MTFYLHVTTASGATFSVTCPSAFLRGLWIISLAGMPCTLISEDRRSA